MSRYFTRVTMSIYFFECQKCQGVHTRNDVRLFLFRVSGISGYFLISRCSPGVQPRHCVILSRCSLGVHGFPTASFSRASLEVQCHTSSSSPVVHFPHFLWKGYHGNTLIQNLPGALYAPLTGPGNLCQFLTLGCWF